MHSGYSLQQETQMMSSNYVEAMVEAYSKLLTHHMMHVAAAYIGC
jgi:hypothetical protein